MNLTKTTGRDHRALIYASTINPSGTAWCYCRYSDGNLQNEYSIDQQLFGCREGARRNGQELPDDCVFADEGVKGWVKSRPALDRLKHLIETGASECTDLYVFETSRLFRDVGLAAELRRFFDVHNVRVHYVADGMVSGGEDHKLIHGVKALFNEQFCDSLGRNVTRGQVHKFETGYYAFARTYGYDHVEDRDPEHAGSFDRRTRKGVLLKINPVQAEVVRLIFALYLEGKGYHGVAVELNKRGVRPARKKKKNPSGLWSISGVRSILGNEKYTGKIVFRKTKSTRDPATGRTICKQRAKGEWRVAQVESLRIISDEDFAIAVAMRNENNRVTARRKGGCNKAAGTYPWSGMLSCGECGGRISICQPHTYMCSVAYKGGECTNKLKLNRDDFQVQMAEHLANALRRAYKFDDLLDALMLALKREKSEAEQAEHASIASRALIMDKLASLDQGITNLVVALSRDPESTGIATGLKSLEAEKKLLMASLGETILPRSVPPQRSEVSDLLSTALKSFAEVLYSDPARCRTELRRRVGEITLTPTTFEGQPAYAMSGYLRIFTPDDTKMLCSNGCARD